VSSRLPALAGRMCGPARTGDVDDNTTFATTASSTVSPTPGLSPSTNRPSSTDTSTVRPVGGVRSCSSVVGFDASPDEVTAIKAGAESASVAQFPAKMGSMGVQTALDAAQGKTVQANVDTGTEMVTKDNASQFGG
jgi:hypothetical protein